ncbi:hypothetical protein GLOTRDRAFT_128658 [Gloeophyllum trabeum ATCC 11539]|uniref:Uncharacterized protein n=1 Tax=Gloeophyllum trabeum (strain ATCC 11539 / FP-39264 / Madison 617) TaxID=670483 RepID=S7QBI8_GLOTA|nr:uncharacterized protein GLOTRDRAFT_128658 [Gloeophyllum trabeum ATCC 11539]EPQ56722.1 hypothetical protein GLOTRDRAFT_128658 [Gloeophyllum trabeum ATCC 11539]
MPPQPGMFPIHSNKSRQDSYGNMQEPSTSYHHNAVAGPSSRAHASSDEIKKDRKRKELAGKLGREMTERKDDSRYFQEAISAQHSTALQLATRPDTCPAYILRLYPLSLERSALLAQVALEEKLALDSVQISYEEERDKVEEEWRRGRERIRERLLEGIEERRRRAREEKDSETIADATGDSQTRSHVTRKLRNKIGTSPPPTPNQTGTAGVAATGTVTNPLSLSIDELPSPFSLPLTATVPQINGTGGGNGRRKQKTQEKPTGGLGKALVILTTVKENEVESDLGEIRRGNKRRRATAAAMGKA